MGSHQVVRNGKAAGSNLGRVPDFTVGNRIRQVSILSNVSRDISAQRAIRRVEKIAFFPLPPQEPEKSG